jgi:ABC-type antimicrobial peptide transport system permease subunit
MRIPVLRGREFTEADATGNPPVVLLSSETAGILLPGQDPIGKHLRFVGQQDWRTVIGVVADVRGQDLRQNVPDFMQGAFYVPYGPGATLENGAIPAAVTLVIRSSLSDRLEQPLRALVATLNPEAPVTEVRPMHSILITAAAAPRSVTSLFAAFAGLAFVLGVVGIYGVIAFFVGQRTREIGIRFALGAQRGDVLRLVFKEGLSLTFLGIATGLAAAFGLTRFLSTLLYGVSATDPLDFAAVAILFAVVSLAACCVPARRAMQVDPLTALRYE